MTKKSKPSLFENLRIFSRPLKFIPLNPRNLYRLSRSTFSAFRSAPEAALPVSVGLECSAVCNLQCKMCFTHNNMHRKKGVMSYENFKKIVNESKPVYLGLSGAGEPFLNKNIFKMIAYAKKKSIVVNLVSNATLLNETISKNIIKSGLDIIKFSFDSTNKDVYESIRKGAKYDTVVVNIKQFIKIKKQLKSKKPEVSINMVVFKDNLHELKDMITFCKEEFDTYPEFIPMFSYGKDLSEDFKSNSNTQLYVQEAISTAKKYGFDKTANELQSLLRDMNNMYDKHYSGPCFLPWISTAITWDGDIFPCCHFINEKANLGNVIEKDFKKVWNGKEFTNFRDQLLKNRGTNKQCMYCGMNDTFLYNTFKKVTQILPPTKLLTQRYKKRT